MTRATRKRWMIGTVVALAVGIATAVAVGRYSQAKKKDDKAAVTLEFAPREVVQPAWTAMPGSIEFSGPLVAPDTAVVRAKAGGTLVGLAHLANLRLNHGHVHNGSDPCCATADPKDFA